MSFDSVDKNRSFAEKFAFPYKLLCDTDKSIAVAYGAADDKKASTAKRISYLIDPNGKIAGSWGIAKKLDTKTHPDEVLREIPAPPA